MYKPLIRSCKLKAEVVVKEWKQKLIKSEKDLLDQEVEFMKSGLQQLKDRITCVGSQLESIRSGRPAVLILLIETQKTKRNFFR